MTNLTLYIAEFGPFFRWNIPNFYFIFRLFCYSNLCKTWKSCRNLLSKLYRLNEYCHLLCRKTTVFRCLKTPWKYRLGTRFFGWFHSYISYYTGCYSLFFLSSFLLFMVPNHSCGVLHLGVSGAVLHANIMGCSMCFTPLCAILIAPDISILKLR